MSNTFELNWGSDLSFELPWPNGSGGTADLTGYSVAIIGANEYLTGLLTATLPIPSNGTIQVRLEWSDTLPKQKRMPFRIQISQGQQQSSTNELGVVYS